MRYQTNLMRAILTNETAQEIIDWVSQLYGESYVGLWVYQVLGFVLGEIRAMAEQLRLEVRPSTAEDLLDLWEKSYGLTIGTGLTPEQRQARLMERRLIRTSASPAALERLVYTVTSRPAKVIENVAPYTFALEIYCEGAEVDFDEVMTRLRRLKPSHQQMQVYITSSSGLRIGVSRTRWPFPYPVAGTRPQISLIGALRDTSMSMAIDGAAHSFDYPMTGGDTWVGTFPSLSADGLTAEAETIIITFVFPLCGDEDT